MQGVLGESSNESSEADELAEEIEALLVPSPRARALLERLRPTTRLQWREIPGWLPPMRNSQGSCVVGKHLYIFGGKCRRTRLNDLHVFDAEAETWECLSKDSPPQEGPVIRSGSLLVHDGQDTLYAACGYDIDGVAHSHVYSFNLRSREWSSTPLRVESSSPVPPARINFRGWFWNGSIYLFGGSPDGTHCFGDLWCFNIALGRWTQLFPKGDGPLPSQWSLCELWRDGKVILFGGHLPSGRAAKGFHILDLTSLEWINLIETMERPLVVGRKEGESDITWESIMCSSSASALFGDILLIYGGWTGSEHKKTLWSVDFSIPSAPAWRELALNPAPGNSRPQGKCSSSAIVWNGKFFLFSGWNGWQQTHDMHGITFTVPSLEAFAMRAILNDPKLRNELDVVRFFPELVEDDGNQCA